MCGHLATYQCTRTTLVWFEVPLLKALASSWFMVLCCTSSGCCLYHPQAVTFLLIGDKSKKTMDDITRLCPALSIQQLFRISTMYWDDNYNTETVSSEVRMPGCQENCEDYLSTSLLDLSTHRVDFVLCELGDAVHVGLHVTRLQFGSARTCC
jgi:hypothetical protein